MHDGSAIKCADPAAARIEWALRYTGLSDTERTQIESFFVDRGGALREFVFVDPTANLLRWTEDSSKDVWVRDALLQSSELELGARLVNAAQIARSIQQTVAAPGWFRYCFSAFVRSAAPVWVRLALANADGAAETVVEAGPEWRRVFCSGAIEGACGEITCRLELPPGAVVDVHGFQLEPQPAPSAYQKTGGGSAVYLATRFATERLQWTTSGIDDHATVIRLVSRARGL
jgi:hypothetical protein